MAPINRQLVLYARKLGAITGHLEDALLALLLGVMVLLAASQIFLRNFWEAGIVWSDPLLRVLVLWLGLLGAMAATRDGNHIKIDLLSKLLPNRFKQVLLAFVNLISSAVCAIVSYHAARFVMMEYDGGTTAFSNIPSWVCESIIPIGFGLMAIRFFTRIIAQYFDPEGATAKS